MKWLKRLGIGLGAVTLWLAATVLMLPSERLCNAALARLAQEQVTLCFEERKTGLLGCEQKRTTLLYGHSEVARVRDLSLTPWLVEARNVRLLGIAAGFVPPAIRRVAFRPLGGEIFAEGEFGKAEGEILWGERKIRIRLTPSTLMRRSYGDTLRYFRKSGGEYLYETRF